MLALLVTFAVLLLAGSLFPWNFQQGPSLAQAIWHVATSWREARQLSSVHDVLINLVIYIPIGFVAYLWQGWKTQLVRWVWIPLGALGLSFSIETLQHYFPPRIPGISDVICNTIGAMIGMVIATLFESALESRHIEWRRRFSLHLSSALLLLVMWISASAWPTHAYPLGIGMRIRALLRPLPWIPMNSLDEFLPSLLFGCLFTTVTGPKLAPWFLWALLPALFLLRLIAPGHDFTWGHVGGALAAATVFCLLPERRRNVNSWLAWVWLAWIMVDGLDPFILRGPPSHFGWIPFRDMLGSSWMPAIGVLLRKTWIYGAAYWLLAHTRLSSRAAISLTMVFLIVIEVAQCWLPGRIASLTDPAIALIVSALLWLVDHRFARKQTPVNVSQPQLH